MNNNINFISDSVIRFHKIKWDKAELSLALCLGFNIDEINNYVDCNIIITTKKSLFYFLKKSFTSLVESPIYKSNRDNLFYEIKAKYNKIIDNFYSTVFPKIPYGGMLYKHQKEAIFYCHSKRFNLLAMDMGTGKTITSASLSIIWNAKRTLIICPSVTKWNWYRDLTEKFGFNKLFFTIIDKSKSKSLNAFVDERFVIVNYEMLKKRINTICEKNIDHIIYDECHFIKNHNSANFDFAQELVKRFPDAKVTLLSGTPVKNRVNDMFAYLKLSKHPLGKNYSFFLREYTNTEFGRGGLRVIGSKNLDDLYSKLSNFMIRYRLEDCVDMPEKVISKLYLSMEEYKDEYNSVIDEMMQQNEKIDIHGSLATLSIVVSKAKIPGIIQLADSIIEEGRKVVIFSSYLSPMDDMEMRYKDKCVRIDGKVDSFEKDKRIQKFWNDDTVNVFLGQTAAAGVGINLTNCNDIIFANFPFTITDMEQAISRCFRIGQKNKVKVYLPIAEGSLDEYVYELLVDKSKDINNLIDKGKSGVTDYANIENKLFSMLMEKYKPKEVSPTDII